MAKGLTLSDLSQMRQKLVRHCQSINYGSIENLLIRDREPVTVPESIVSVDVKLDSDEHPRKEVNSTDFPLSSEVCRLMALLDQINNAKISRLDVRAGIPRRIIFEHRISELGGVSS